MHQRKIIFICFLALCLKKPLLICMNNNSDKTGERQTEPNKVNKKTPLDDLLETLNTNNMIIDHENAKAYSLLNYSKSIHDKAYKSYLEIINNAERYYQNTATQKNNIARIFGLTTIGTVLITYLTTSDKIRNNAKTGLSKIIRKIKRHIKIINSKINKRTKL